MKKQNNFHHRYQADYIRIEVCGGIASGKTTFAGLMRRMSIQPLFENFRTNPFWEAFYSNPGEYIFETEVTFTLQHYHQIKEEQAKNKITICDFSFLLDIAYAEIGLTGTKLKAFMTVYDEIRKELPPQILLIHLRCTAEAELERIRKRARAEEKLINIEFLRSLNLAVDRQVEKMKNEINVVSIDSALKNFADDEAVQEEIVNLVSNSLKSLVAKS